MPTNAAMIEAHERQFSQAVIKPEWRARIAKDAVRLCSAENKKWFLQESQRLGGSVPWWFIATTKEMEAGPDPSFLRSIAQGDRWDRKSVNVPRGRGPFKSWFEAADDALVNCGPYAGRWQNWSIGGALTIALKYNGLGYWPNVSPYLFSMTTVYVKGKYTSDGHFDPEAVSQQVGVAALWIEMQKIDPSIVFGPAAIPPRATPEPPKEIVKDATKTERKTRTGGVATAGAGAGNEAGKATTQQPDKLPLAHSYVAYAAIGIGIAVAIVASVLIARKVKAINDIW